MSEAYSKIKKLLGQKGPRKTQIQQLAQQRQGKLKFLDKQGKPYKTKQQLDSAKKMAADFIPGQGTVDQQGNSRRQNYRKFLGEMKKQQDMDAAMLQAGVKGNQYYSKDPKIRAAALRKIVKSMR